MTPHEFQAEREKLGPVVRVAGMLGVQPTAITSWEKGERPIPTMAELSLKYLLTPKPELNGVERTRQEYQDAEMLTQAQTASYLGVDRRTVLDWVNAGLLAKPTVGHIFDGKQDRKIHWFKRTDLDAFIAADHQRLGQRRRRRLK